jgi:hypothetical protein
MAGDTRLHTQLLADALRLLKALNKTADRRPATKNYK